MEKILVISPLGRKELEEDRLVSVEIAFALMDLEIGRQPKKEMVSTLLRLNYAYYRYD